MFKHSYQYLSSTVLIGLLLVLCMLTGSLSTSGKMFTPLQPVAEAGLHLSWMEESEVMDAPYSQVRRAQNGMGLDDVHGSVRSKFKQKCLCRKSSLLQAEHAFPCPFSLSGLTFPTAVPHIRPGYYLFLFRYTLF